MAGARKVFRIETQVSDPRDHAGAGSSGVGGEIGMQILRELGEVRRMIVPQQEVQSNVLDEYRRQVMEAMALKAELDSICTAINETKKEIASLHLTGFRGREMMCVTDELGAIVQGTESATEGILTAAEAIDEMISTLAGQLNGQSLDLAHDISDQVVQIFEACNFQDLTGQRITKVVNVLGFIEERVARMMEIWGGIEHFAHLEIETMPVREGDAALLNGPSLATDVNSVSQDDIDALFN